MSDERPATPEPGEPSTPSTPSTPAPRDEAPTAPVERASAGAGADEAPTDATPPGAAPTGAEATPSPAPVASVPATADRGRGVFVPAWVAVVAGILLVALLGFAIGWIAAPGDDADTSNAVATQPSPGTDDSDSGDDRSDDDRDRGTSPDVPGRDERGDGGPAVPPLLGGGFLGVTVETVEDDGGARITAVADDGPAAEAGLQAGDVVTGVDGDDVSSSLDLIRAVRGHEPDDSISLTYTRGGDTAEAEVTLAERPTSRSVS